MEGLVEISAGEGGGLFLEEITKGGGVVGETGEEGLGEGAASDDDCGWWWILLL